MSNASQRHRLSLWLCLGAAAIALVFALYTNHVWEDYYITYRSSKNLATGHGLVFNQDDRLHTFTSPLGVLLPAVCSAMVANSSDTAALWLFRLGSIAALGGAVGLLLALADRLRFSTASALLLGGLVAIDAKSVDFSINGMETGFMLLFLAYALWAHFAPGARQWLHLGAAWAGLMWTRPDSFIYIGLIGAGVWLFNDPEHTGRDRRALLGLYLRAGLLTTALYGPWILWAWWYYGTPIPHTIIAKGTQGGGLGAGWRFLHGFWRLPVDIWQGKSAAEGVFLPAYYTFPSWPAWMLPYGRAVASVCSVLWLIPGLRSETRIASFTFFGAVAYLSYVPYYPFPWYYPAPFCLSALVLAGVFAQLWQSGRRWLQWPAAALILLCVAGSAYLTLGVARQMRAQQRLVETGIRQRIGEWLHVHAQPGDTVFMEPLGYIGYFSGLKTYDWPGLSSREVLEARRLVGPDWSSIIPFLQPTWVILRVSGEGDMSQVSRALNEISYERVHDFDRTAEILSVDVPGRKYLEFESHFAAYHRRYPTRHDADGYRIASSIGSSLRNIGDAQVRLVHVPGDMVAPLPLSAREAVVRFGFPDEASAGPSATDGAIFEVWLVDGKERSKLYALPLQPTLRLEDRGLKEAVIVLPSRHHPEDAFLDLATKPRGGNSSISQGWTCWANPLFR